MSKRTTTNWTEQLEVMRLLADVATLKADPLAQRQLLVDGVNDILHTQAGWLVVVDDFTVGKTPMWRERTLARDPDPEFLKSLDAFSSDFPMEAEPTADHVIRDRSPLQLWQRDRVFAHPDAKTRYAASIAMYDDSKVVDGSTCVFRDDRLPDRVVAMAFHRMRREPRLLRREHALLQFVVAEVHGLVRRGHLTLAAPAVPGLSPRLDLILRRMLAGAGVKQMARELGLSVWTVREYIQRLYRHFDVNSREELMSKFVNR